MRYIRLLFSLCAIIFVLPTTALADGAMVTPPDYYINEADQTAVLFYEANTQTETMVVQTEYTSNAKDFVWIIPTPAQPDIKRGSQTILTNLATLTNPYSSDYQDGLGLGTTGAAPEDTRSTVNVIAEKSVDYYDAVVLQATNATDLVQWLNDHGYTFQDNNKYILEDYLSNGWYFTALRIDLSALDTLKTTKKAQALTPIQLTFSANHLVYPLRISSISAKTGSQPVTLYVLDDHKLLANNFSISYSNAVSKTIIENWGTDTNGNPWVQPINNSYYLTKLHANLSASEMTDDVFFTDAKDNASVGTGPTWDWDAEDWGTFILMMMLALTVSFAGTILSPFGVGYIIATIVRVRAKHRGWQIAGAIVQWLNYVTIMTVYTLFWVMNWKDFIRTIQPARYSSYHADSIGVIAGLMIMALGVALILLVINFLTGKFRARSHELRS